MVPADPGSKCRFACPGAGLAGVDQPDVHAVPETGGQVCGASPVHEPRVETRQIDVVRGPGKSNAATRRRGSIRNAAIASGSLAALLAVIADASPQTSIADVDHDVAIAGRTLMRRVLAPEDAAAEDDLSAIGASNVSGIG